MAENENLTEREGLRMLLTVEAFQRKSSREGEGFFARLVRLITGRSAASNTVQDYEYNSDVLEKLEWGHQIPLRESRWSSNRVLVVDERIRTLEIAGVTAPTLNRQEQVVLDLTIGYQVQNANQVAYGAVDPLRQLRNVIVDKAREFVAARDWASLDERSLAQHIQSLGTIVSTGLGVLDVQTTILLPKDAMDAKARIRAANLRQQAIDAELQAEASIEARKTTISFDAEEHQHQRSHQLATVKLQDQSFLDQQTRIYSHDATMRELEFQSEELRERRGVEGLRRDIDGDQSEWNRDQEARQLDAGRKHALLDARNSADIQLLQARNEESIKTERFAAEIKRREIAIESLVRVAAQIGLNPRWVAWATDHPEIQKLIGIAMEAMKSEQQFRLAGQKEVYATVRQLLAQAPTDEAVEKLANLMEHQIKMLGEQPSSNEVWRDLAQSIEQPNIVGQLEFTTEKPEIDPPTNTETSTVREESRIVQSMDQTIPTSMDETPMPTPSAETAADGSESGQEQESLSRSYPPYEDDHLSD